MIGGAQAALGGVQMIAGLINGHRAQRDLEGLQTPTETANAAVNSYYNKASANAYDTPFYNMQKQNASRGLIGGLNQLQTRHSAIAGISSLVRGQNDALLKAGAQADNMQNARLASATQMKAADDRRLFDINKMLPYQKKFSLLGAKAAGANQMANAGIHNLFGGGSTAAMASGNNSSAGGYNPYLGSGGL
jgi:hypothetical protein